MRFQHSQEGKFRAPLPPQGLNLNKDSLIIKYLLKPLFCGISPFKKGTINQPTNVPILKRSNGCNIQIEQLLGLSQRLLSTTAATLQPGSSEEWSEVAGQRGGWAAGRPSAPGVSHPPPLRAGQ